MEQIRKLPIGIQTFDKLREGGFLYVDKTAMIYQITVGNEVGTVSCSTS